jgi:hypothetical protein
MAEDIAETKYLAQPTAEHRDEWVRALDKSILKLMALRDAAVGA